MVKYESQIAELQLRIDCQHKRLKDLRAKAGAEKRKQDTRRKIVFGYAFLEWLKTLSPNERHRILVAVHGRLCERDRIEFPIPTVTKDFPGANPQCQARTGELKVNAGAANLPFS